MMLQEPRIERVLAVTLVAVMESSSSAVNPLLTLCECRSARPSSEEG